MWLHSHAVVVAVGTVPTKPRLERQFVPRSRRHGHVAASFCSVQDGMDMWAGTRFTWAIEIWRGTECKVTYDS